MVEEKNDARGPPTALDRLRWKVARAGRKNDVAGIVVFRRITSSGRAISGMADLGLSYQEEFWEVSNLQNWENRC